MSNSDNNLILSDEEIELIATEKYSTIDGFAYLFASKMIGNGKYQSKLHFFCINDAFYIIDETQSGSYFTEQHSEYYGPNQISALEFLETYIEEKEMISPLIKAVQNGVGKDFLLKIEAEIKTLKTTS